MNIWLPIVTNLVIILIAAAGMINGKRNGFKVEFTKLVILLMLGVGCYFLTPLMVGVIDIMPFAEILSAETLFAITFASLFLIAYFIESMIFTIARLTHGSSSMVKVSKSIKIKSTGKSVSLVDGRTTLSKVWGAIFGLITAIVISFVLMTVFKFIALDISCLFGLTEIFTGYEYTIFGQADKLFELSNIFIKI